MGWVQVECLHTRAEWIRAEGLAHSFAVHSSVKQQTAGRSCARCVHGSEGGGAHCGCAPAGDRWLRWLRAVGVQAVGAGAGVKGLEGVRCGLAAAG